MPMALYLSNELRRSGVFASAETFAHLFVLGEERRDTEGGNIISTDVVARGSHEVGECRGVEEGMEWEWEDCSEGGRVSYWWNGSWL